MNNLDSSIYYDYTRIVVFIQHCVISIEMSCSFFLACLETTKQTRNEKPLNTIVDFRHELSF